VTSAAKAANENKAHIAALKRCATQNQTFPQPERHTPTRIALAPRTVRVQDECEDLCTRGYDSQEAAVKRG